jgi:hypothetical protein
MARLNQFNCASSLWKKDGYFRNNLATGPSRYNVEIPFLKGEKMAINCNLNPIK